MSSRVCILDDGMNYRLPTFNPLRVGKLQPDDAMITVVLFEIWQTITTSQTLQSGDQVTARGELAEYRGKLELQPELSIDVMKEDGEQ